VLLCLLPASLLAEEGRGQPRDQSLHQVEHIIIIYQENWSFDSLYGLFPGANGLRNASMVSLTQRDRLTGQPYSAQLGHPFDLVSGSLALTTPPQPIDTNVSPPQLDPRFPADLHTLLPYNLVTQANLQPSEKTGDIVHRFWHG